MPGGPIFPYSAVPVSTGKVFPYIHISAGAYSKHEEGLGVMSSVNSDAVWRLRFRMPPVLPSGTCKLDLRALANATTGLAVFNPKWGSCAVEEDPGSTTLVAEGTQIMSWGAGDNDQYKQTLVTMDGDTLVAGETVVMDLTFEVNSWSLAQVSTWSACLIWE
jgi:hypothetical protein